MRGDHRRVLHLAQERPAFRRQLRHEGAGHVGRNRQHGGGGAFDVLDTGRVAPGHQDLVAAFLDLAHVRVHEVNRARHGRPVPGEAFEHGRGDRTGHFILERHDIGRIALVALGPQLMVGRGIDQLRGDAHRHVSANARHRMRGIKCALSALANADQ